MKKFIFRQKQTQILKSGHLTIKKRAAVKIKVTETNRKDNSIDFFKLRKVENLAAHLLWVIFQIFLPPK